jgi:FkbM family methyltransferase
VSLTRRALGAFSRRLGRPELVSAFYPLARRDEQEALAMRVVFASVLRADSSYVDVGAYRGAVLRDAVRIAPGGRHLAFEPVPDLAAVVEREFPGVECRRLALGAQRGEAQFCHFREPLDGWSGLRRNPAISDAQGRPEFIGVTVSTLDEEVKGLEPTLIKIDVEGAELDVLRGAGQLLAAARPTLILEHVASAAELYGTSSTDVFDALSGHGYEIFSLTGDGPVTRKAFGASELVVNWLATPLR